MSLRTPRTLLLFAALLPAPLLLGADGCVREVAVGLQHERSDRDAAVGPMDAGVASDAGSMGACTEAQCGVAPKVPSRRCDDGSTAGPVCGRNAAGMCAWTITSCPPPSDRDAGELPACEPVECQGPWVQVSALPNDTNCSDGTSPVCKRNADGWCEYQCEPQAACGTATGTGCAANQLCVFTLGSCGPSDKSGGLCQNIPQSCSADYQPVCGCDGKTYSNACGAAAAGVSISFEGECATEPMPCQGECPGPAPSVPTVLCDDGVHERGPACITRPDGSCVWQWLECPSTGTCVEKMDLPVGRCFTDEQCMAGQTCQGANRCPCDAKCFAGDVPGYCK